MMTVNIKIELNNLDKVKVELNALLATVDELAKTYPTTFVKEPVEEPAIAPAVKKPAAAKKPAAKKPAAKKPAAKKEPVEDPAECTLIELAKKAVAGSDRDTVRDTIAGFSTNGKLSGVEEDKEAELRAALGSLVA